MSTLLQQLRAQQRRERNGKKKRKKKTTKRRKKATTKRRKKATTKRRKTTKKAPKRTTKKRRTQRGASVGAYSFGALMRRGGKRKINVERTRSRIRNLYKQGQLAEANRLRARLKAAGYEYK